MSVVQCINLEQMFGDKYRISWEADGATKGQWHREDYPWLMEIRGRSGVVYPYGGDMLAVLANRPGAIRRIKALTFLSSRLDGEEFRATFPSKNAKAVLSIIQARRKRQISDEQRAALIARLAKVRAKRGLNPTEDG